MTTTTCAGPCARTLPKTEDHFILRRYRTSRTRRQRVVEAWTTVCRRCLAEIQSAARKKVAASKRSARRARTEITCTGPCGRTKPATEEYFHRRPNGELFLACRTCANARAAEYRRSPRYLKITRRKSWRRHRRAAAVRQRAGNTERSSRYYEARKADPAFQHHRKVVNCLAEELRSGRLVKPARCARCVRGPAGGYRLRARFLTVPESVGAIEWLCCPHHWAATAGARYVAERAEERRDDARAAAVLDEASPAGRRCLLAALACEPAEWRAIHEAHLAEVGVPNAAHQAERARYREAFRKTVLSRGAEGRLRGALASIPMGSR